MIGFKDYIAESVDSDKIMEILKSVGYHNIKVKSSNRFSVLTDGDRVQTIQAIESLLKSNYTHAEWDKAAGHSSLGAVVIGKIHVSVSPANMQGKASAGLGNEFTLMHMISEITKNGPIDIAFIGNGHEYTVRGCTGFTDAGRNTSGRRKADIIMHTEKGHDHPISIKKDNAEMWESADSFYWKEAKRRLEELEKKGKITVTPLRNVFKISPNFAVRATDKEARNVVFGSDILGKGAVIESTFTGKYDIKDGVAHIKVSNVITNMNHLSGKNSVWFLVRNDSSRKGSKIMPGVRALAVKETRINRNVLRVN